MNNIVRVSKNKNTPYVMLDKRLTENSNLSYAARGMMAYLLSKPDGWQVRMTDLENSGTEGHQRIRSIFKELEEARHLYRERTRTPDGKYEWVTTIYEIPVLADHDTADHGSVPTDGNEGDIVFTQSLSTHNDTNVSAAPPAQPTKRVQSAEQQQHLAVRRCVLDHFEKITHLKQPQKGSGVSTKGIARLWWNPIREICALGEWDENIARKLVTQAVERLEGLTVSDPNSILKTCRALAARGVKPQSSQGVRMSQW